MGAHGQQEVCQFFYKVGSCRHGNKCVRKHVIPSSSKAIVLVSIPLPQSERGSDRSSVQMDELLQDIFIEVALIAPIKELFVAANESPHLKGHIYISFASETEAAEVLTNINSRWFDERPIFAHYLPSQVLSMAVCREGDSCQRKLDCNYAHPMHLNEQVCAELFAAQTKEYTKPAQPKPQLNEVGI